MISIVLTLWQMNEPFHFCTGSSKYLMSSMMRSWFLIRLLRTPLIRHGWCPSAFHNDLINLSAFHIIWYSLFYYCTGPCGSPVCIKNCQHREGGSRNYFDWCGSHQIIAVQTTDCVCWLHNGLFSGLVWLCDEFILGFCTYLIVMADRKIV